MEKQSDLWQITNPPENPMDLFKRYIDDFENSFSTSIVPLNLATRNAEFGVSNRTVLFRGLKDSDICFVTEKNSRKYAEIEEDPRVAVTFLVGFRKEDITLSRQIRIIGRAVELLENEKRELWEEEHVHAKIRNHICETGKPTDWTKLKAKHDELLRKYENGEIDLKQTESYTAFRIVADTIDFYETTHNTIADRVIYRRSGATWSKEHVCA